RRPPHQEQAHRRDHRRRAGRGGVTARYLGGGVRLLLRPARRGSAEAGRPQREARGRGQAPAEVVSCGENAGERAATPSASLNARSAMYHEHPHFKLSCSEDSKVWRYLDFTKYVSMLEEGALWFSRADRLGDPFDSELPNSVIARMKQSRKEALDAV